MAGIFRSRILCSSKVGFTGSIRWNLDPADVETNAMIQKTTRQQFLTDPFLSFPISTSISRSWQRVHISSEARLAGRHAEACAGLKTFLILWIKIVDMSRHEAEAHDLVWCPYKGAIFDVVFRLVLKKRIENVHVKKEVEQEDE